MWLDILPQIIEEGNRRGLHTLKVDNETYKQIVQEIQKIEPNIGDLTYFGRMDAETKVEIIRGVRFILEMK